MPVTHCGVVGHPAAHSLSPVMHREAYRLLGLTDWRYGWYDVAPGEFGAFVASRDASWRGLSVTMPHKEAAARLGDPDAEVRLTGVANTVVWHDQGRRSVHNTDVAGFVAALAPGGVPAAATVLGAGATARSAIVALARLGVRAVEVKARSYEKVRRLVEWAGRDVPLGPGGRGYTAGDWESPQDPSAALIISTLPHDAAGPLADTLRLAPGGPLLTVFDVAYDPWPTPLAAAALASGVGVLDGVDLLAHQAVAQVRLMTSGEVDAAPLLSVARAELRRRAGA